MYAGNGFSLMLFSTSRRFIGEAVEAGVDTIIVDWEHRNKLARQVEADTEINHDTLEDLRRVREATEARVVCRINGYHDETREEVERAVGAGADEILLPMVAAVEEVERVLEHARGRCGVGILVETKAATHLACKLARLPLSRVFLGLNDLAIERHTPNIFTAIADGTVERVRSHFQAPFGFGGLTLPEAGRPLQCRLLIGEMARLRCGFSFLRRSFHRDIADRELSVEIPRLRAAVEAARQRPLSRVARDNAELVDAIRALDSKRDFQ
jgi:hypothetical protein